MSEFYEVDWHKAKGERVFESGMENWTNFHQFIYDMTPRWKKKFVTLQELWDFYDEPYGIENRIQVGSEIGSVYFFPHLSFVQLGSTEDNLENKDEMHSREQEGLEGKSKRDNMSVLLGNKALFKFDEAKAPDQRDYIIDKIKRLAKKFPFLLKGTSDKVTADSFYCILWCPILCQHDTMHLLSGTILTYHAFSLSPEITSDASVNQSFKKHRKLSDQDMYSTLLGYFPYKIKHDTWLKDLNSKSIHKFCTPIPLIKNAIKISSQQNHHDYNHISKAMKFVTTPKENGYPTETTHVPQKKPDIPDS